MRAYRVLVGIVSSLLLAYLLIPSPVSVHAQSGQLPYGGMIPANPLAFCPGGSMPIMGTFTKGSAGNIQAIAGTSGKRIYVLGYVIYTLAASNLKFQEGTGSNCATGAADVTQIFSAGGTTTAVTSPSFLEHAPIQTATQGNALCVNGSAATTISGYLLACQF